MKKPEMAILTKQKSIARLTKKMTIHGPGQSCIFPVTWGKKQPFLRSFCDIGRNNSRNCFLLTFFAFQCE